MFPKIGVPPNHPFLIGFSIINHPFWGPTPIFGNTHKTRTRPMGMTGQSESWNQGYSAGHCSVSHLGNGRSGTGVGSSRPVGSEGRVEGGCKIKGGHVSKIGETPLEIPNRKCVLVCFCFFLIGISLMDFVLASSLGRDANIKHLTPTGLHVIIFWGFIQLMERILHQLILVDLVGSLSDLSHYLQGFVHPRWCRISSINSIIPRNLEPKLTLEILL